MGQWEMVVEVDRGRIALADNGRDDAEQGRVEGDVRSGAAGRARVQLDARIL